MRIASIWFENCSFLTISFVTLLLPADVCTRCWAFTSSPFFDTYFVDWVLWLSIYLLRITSSDLYDIGCRIHSFNKSRETGCFTTDRLRYIIVYIYILCTNGQHPYVRAFNRYFIYTCDYTTYIHIYSCTCCSARRPSLLSRGYCVIIGCARLRRIFPHVPDRVWANIYIYI